MRTLHLLSGVGVAMVAAWLAVTNLAYAAEFACTIPWYTDTDCGIPKFSIPPGGTVTIDVFTVTKDGRNLPKDRCPVFQIFDVNNKNIVLYEMTGMCAGQSKPYVNPLKTTEQIVYVRANIKQGNDIHITGKYVVTK